MAFAEDLTAFLSTNDFAVMATVNGAQVAVIYTADYTPASVGSFGMASSSPAIELRTQDVPPSPAGKPVTVNGAAYTIAEHQPDGTGMSVLILTGAA